MADQSFTYRGRDGVAIFWIIIVVFFPGGICLGPVFMSIKVLITSLIVFFILILGLDCEISVEPGRVRFSRRLFSMPYFIKTGTAITFVAYDSDWDEEKTASGVVVEIDGREIHIGSAKRKTLLYEGLCKSCAMYQSSQSGKVR